MEADEFFRVLNLNWAHQYAIKNKKETKGLYHQLHLILILNIQSTWIKRDIF